MHSYAYLDESSMIVRRITGKLNDGWGADPVKVWEVACVLKQYVRARGNEDFTINLLVESPITEWFEWQVGQGWMQKIQRGNEVRYALTSNGERLADIHNERGGHQIISVAVGCDYLSLEALIPWDEFKH